MNLFSSIQLGVFVLFFYFFLITYYKKPKSQIYKIFALYITCFLIWTFSFIFVYSENISPEITRVFYNIGSIGWLCITSFHLWFSLAFCNKKKILSKKLLYFYLFLPPAVFYGLKWTENFTVEITNTPIFPQSIWTYLFFIFQASNLFFSVHVLINFLKNSNDLLKKRQTKIILLSMFVSGLFIALFDILMPMRHLPTPFHLTNFAGIILLSGIFYAINSLQIWGPQSITVPLDKKDIQFKENEILLNQQGHSISLNENIQEGIFLISKEKFKFVNNRFANLLGYSVEELMGKKLKDIITPEDIKLIDSLCQKQTEKNGTPAIYKLRLIHRNGFKIHVNISVKAIKLNDCLVRVGTLKDISDQIQFEKAIQELKEKLNRAEKMAGIGRLASGVAHDLNNVLSAIVCYPDLLLMKLPQDSPLRKSIHTIKHSGMKASAIVQDLLTLARRGITVKKNENLNDIINDYICSPEFERLVQNYPKIKYKTQLHETLPNIEGSAIHLFKIVLNLITNSTEAMPSGEGTIQISTTVRKLDKPTESYYHTIKKGCYVVLTVSDNGVGINAEDLKKIFEPFYTKKKMGRSGTGLGMSIVWGILEDHHGYIDVDSTPEKGTTFRIYFPKSMDENYKKEELHDIPINKYKGKGEKILVVDDEHDQREIAAVLLMELGYMVHTVSSGEEAINFIKSRNVDIMLLDMLMSPGIDGLETFKKILKIRPEVKTIITSGFSQSERVNEALNLGAKQYIKKPYTMEKIGMALINELKGKK